VKLLFGNDRYVAEIVGDALGIFISPPYTAIGFLDDAGSIRGGAIFNNYNQSNIEVTVYAKNIATRGMIRAVMHYVFVQLNCNRLTARTRKSNKVAQKMLPRMGFKYEATLQLYYGPDKNDAAVLYWIDRQTALERWLDGKPASPDAS
jgi:RimJ/RimL family protein N-acetyltransferase